MASDAEVLVVDVRAVAKGYRLSKLIGYDVVNDRDEEIGTLDDLIIAKDADAMFAVLQIGGFLRLGGRLIAIPFEQLDLRETDDTLRIVLPGATRETLQELPEFDYRS
jgi:sporulation protein YlmC with PRC-barrel domain